MNYFLTILLKLSLKAIFEAVKRLTAIAFILLLSAQCIFKLGIITYFEANRDYIAEVLCVNKEKPMTMCHGKCFLDRNLSIGDGEGQKPIPVTTKLQIETSFFITNGFSLNLKRTSKDIEKISSPEPLYQFHSQYSFFHPPC